MRKIFMKIKFAPVVLIAMTFFLIHPVYDALAGKVEPVCSGVTKEGAKIIIPIKVTNDKDQIITAWGLDITLKGLEYVEWVKAGSLAGGSDSFMCNQLANGNVRCGSYTGNLNIKGEQTLFKLVVKKKAGAKESSISLLNFVDHLAGVQASECKLP